MPAPALELARSAFPGLIEAEPWRPLDLAPDERVATFLDSFTALVERSMGGGPATALVDSSLPLRSTLETGEPKLVDLGLQAAGDGYEPRNPLVIRLGPSVPALARAARAALRSPGRGLVEA